MRLSRTVTETALLLKYRAPWLYASIRDNTPTRLRSIINARMTIDSLGTDDPELVFTNIFRKNWWNNGESRSGWGAELQRTMSIRLGLPEFVQRHSIGSLLDAPCGDFHWMQHVEWPAGFRYIGADIVADLIAENRRKYPTVEFLKLDVLSDPLPTVDCWLARDLMIHFPDQAIWAALDQFRKSPVRFLLATTYPNARRNHDIKFGQVRHLNLCAPPFNLPQPYEMLHEDDDLKTGRAIGVWRRSDIECTR
ncbi:MAG: class I SAM-dependent methyltransferase [Bradyrhizobium sp.]|nr:class I SAM-dependent methyltransferase [Bradyrhizobium sp.]